MNSPSLKDEKKDQVTKRYVLKAEEKVEKKIQAKLTTITA